MPELRGGALIALILAVSGLDFLLFGYDQGLFGGILAGQGFINMLGNPSPTLTGFVTAVYDIGCACGAVAAFLFGEKVGRKKSIIIANCIGKLHTFRTSCQSCQTNVAHQSSPEPLSWPVVKIME